MTKGGGKVPDLFEYAAERAKKTVAAPAREDAARATEDPEATGTSASEETSAAPAAGSREAPLSVTQLVRRAGHAVERAFGSLWVEGEIASLSRAASGHLYFVLKDDRAEVRAVMWRSEAQRLKFRPNQGMAVRCRVRPTIYDQGGKFQLYVTAIEPSGVGADALALEELRQKLAAEGLFAAERKRILPVLPRRIGVVTSKSGAAVRDIIRATQRRFPVPILVADAAVQGEGSAAQMVRALAALSRCDVDVVIIGRGGGSASDLSAFNDEALVRAVAACPIPTISAVGHEVDVSLCDLAADHRAATPTMAGEMAVPVLADLEAQLGKEERRLRRELDVRLAAARQNVDRLLERAHGSTTRRLHQHRTQLAELRRRLDAEHPRARLAVNRGALVQLDERARSAMRRRLDRSASALGDLAGRLAALSPLRVLERGYALATVDAQVLVDSAQVSPGDRVDVRLARGILHCVADSISREPEE